MGGTWGMSDGSAPAQCGLSVGSCVPASSIPPGQGRQRLSGSQHLCFVALQGAGHAVLLEFSSFWAILICR